MAYYDNIPIASSQNIPLALSAQYDGGFVGGHRRRRYIRADQIEKLAVDKYKKNSQGLIFRDLLRTDLASNKEQSQLFKIDKINSQQRTGRCYSNI